MKNFTRRYAIHLLTRAPLASSVILSGSLGRAMMALPTQQLENSVDWSKGVVDTTMSRFPDPKTLGGWGYAISLYLYGQYLVYKRTGEQKYLDYIRGWVDHLVSDEGVISRPISALDYMLPGNLLLILFQETRQEKYRKAAESIRVRFDTYPRTEDGGFWHALSRQHQLWLDGIFMSMPFLVRYGQLFHDETYTCDEAAKQILIYAKHLNDPKSGLMYHAYDESGQQPWTDAVTHHSSFFWGRAIGWFGMATIEVLEALPHSHPHRKELIALVKQLSEAYRKYQDPQTGLWYQVVDKGALSENWLETSCSSMYTYTLSRAVQRGYVSRKYLDAACHGYRGVLTQLSRDSEGHAHIANICEGTNVGDLNFYFQRPRKTDDFHGIGAFLIMNEQLRTTACAQKATSQVS
jgi:unsaturated rhamnogalacturonyl hydrolase